MRHPSMFFVLLFASVALPAQQAPGNTAPAATANDRQRQMLQSLKDELRMRFEARAGIACPAGFSVNRRADGAIVFTYANQAVPRGQGLDITFARPSARIVSADIVVHGYPASIQAIPATPSAPKDVSQTFHLIAGPDQPLLHSSVWTEHITAINWVELTRLDYADGSSWQSATPRQCVAAPSLYLPIAASTR
jgi:hypothetical protein